MRKFAPEKKHTLDLISLICRVQVILTSKIIKKIAALRGQLCSMFNNKEEHATYDLKSLQQEDVCEDSCGDIVTVMIELGGVAIQKNTGTCFSFVQES